MFKFKKGDFVKILNTEDENFCFESKVFRGEEGVVSNVNKSLKYPYEIAFFDKEIQKENNNWGWLGWKEEELEFANY